MTDPKNVTSHGRALWCQLSVWIYDDSLPSVRQWFQDLPFQPKSVSRDLTITHLGTPPAQVHHLSTPCTFLSECSYIGGRRHPVIHFRNPCAILLAVLPRITDLIETIFLKSLLLTILPPTPTVRRGPAPHHLMHEDLDYLLSATHTHTPAASQAFPAAIVISLQCKCH